MEKMSLVQAFSILVLLGMYMHPDKSLPLMKDISLMFSFLRDSEYIFF
jgi:hypothetical protein